MTPEPIGSGSWWKVALRYTMIASVLVGIAAAWILSFAGCQAEPRKKVGRPEFFLLPEKPSARMQHKLDHTVEVRAVCGIGVSRGTGVVVRSKPGRSVVVTAAHIGEEGCYFEVGDKYAHTRIVHDKADVAVLVTDHDFELSPVNIQKASLGESIWVTGFPADRAHRKYGLVVSNGVIAKIEKDEYRFTAIAYFGNSGGPVWSRSGKLVGIVSNMYGYYLPGGNFNPYEGYFYAARPRSIVETLKKLEGIKVNAID